MRPSSLLTVPVLVLGTFLGLLLLCVSGCGRRVGPTVELAGKVTLDGKPFSEGSIWFTCPRTGAGFHANLQPDGQYSLKISEVQLGETYRVSIGGAEPEAASEPDASGNPRGVVAPPVPMKYRDSATSGLTALVDKAQRLTFEFDLKSK